MTRWISPLHFCGIIALTKSKLKCEKSNKNTFRILGWLVGCFGFNGPL